MPTPLPTLLSQLLIAYTIEFDNTFEERMPTISSTYGFSSDEPAVYSVSMVGWLNFMRVVTDGVLVGEVPDLIGIPMHSTLGLNGVQRWGYVRMGEGSKIESRPKKDQAFTLMPAGQRAREIWEPLNTEIDRRWDDRYGEEVERLRACLDTVVADLGLDAYPWGLPLTDHVGKSTAPLGTLVGDGDVPLATQLSRVLVAFTLEFEEESLSLPVSANIIRVLGDEAVRVADLPLLSGIRKEAIASALKALQSADLVSIRPNPSGKRGKVVQLTMLGQAAKDDYLEGVEAIEAGWRQRLGAGPVDALRAALESMHDERLARGLEPPETCWRAHKPYAKQTERVLADPTGALPHHPLPRQDGYPDGP